MANLTPPVLIAIAVGIGILALLIGYFIGTRFGGKKSVAMREASEKHDSYKNDVREHFEQTSAIMSRMVEDYRDMYRHMADGAQKLADIHPEKHVTPPPEPEAITEDHTGKEADKSVASGVSKPGDKDKDKAASDPAGIHGGETLGAADPATGETARKSDQKSDQKSAAKDSGARQRSGDSASADKSQNNKPASDSATPAAGNKTAGDKKDSQAGDSKAGGTSGGQ